MDGTGVDIDALRAASTRQGGKVRQMKMDGANADDIQVAVAKLKEIKVALEKAEAREATSNDGIEFIRNAMEGLLTRKMFVIPSFEIYGGVSGFYDFGPPACGLKANLLDLWRRHFVFQERMLEIECTNLMPEVVLQTSGHVERFTDLMVKDMKTGECYRADKLLQDYVENLLKNSPIMPPEEQERHRLNATKAESFTPEEIHTVFQEYGIKSPSSGGELSEPRPFNLMFKCKIGPEGQQTAYLRPETAQGIFLNFRRLLEFNGGKFPFAAAQIGSAFRNEISPRMGLLRVREFQQAEIEYFVNPKDKSHPNFASIAGNKLTLFPKGNQLGHGKCVLMTARDAVAQGVIANEALAYFIARTKLFCDQIGLDEKRIRFRQHLDTEMAHYACDCWDLEVKLLSGWTECAGHADRSCYDLEVHAKKSKVEMVGTLKYDTPKVVETAVLQINRGKVGKEFKQDNSVVVDALNELRSDLNRALDFDAELEAKGQATLGPLCNGKSFTLTRDMISFTKTTKTMMEEKFVPSVIEPSFGIGRIMTAIFEHSFYVREGDEKRGVMGLRPSLAATKVAVAPLSSNSVFDPFLESISESLTTVGITVKMDNSSVTIGRKYARADELGVPFVVTVDFDTIVNYTVTLRERDSCSQLRLCINEVPNLVLDLVKETITWKNAMCKYPVVTNREEKVGTSKLVVDDTGRGRFHRPAAPRNLEAASVAT